MTDTKHAALELAKQLDILHVLNDDYKVVYDDDLHSLYDAARKPLEDAAQDEINRLQDQVSNRDMKIENLQQQLLQNQEAYQRVVDASLEVVRISDRKHDAWDKLKEALANPPSLEALERDRAKRKVQAELIVLSLVEDAPTHSRDKSLRALIVNRMLQSGKLK